MPTLDWIGKAAVVNHHYDVPFHFLERKYGASDENMIIHGDNLPALKSLMPRFEGRIKCIYIDPPYNTGNESWVYNDNVSDPALEKWLGEVVGREGEDFTRHDKWLCMMYPRLRLMQRLLSEDGAIFISIDDNEQANLKLMCDEIFGAQNFFAMLTRRSMHTVRNSSKDFNKNSDFVLVYGKNKTRLTADKDHRIREQVDKAAAYRFNDGDGRGFYKLDPIYARNYFKPYTVTFKNGVVWSAPEGSYPRYSIETLKLMESRNRIDFNGKQPRAKRYLNEVQQGQPPDTFLKEEKVGFNSDGTKTLAQVLGIDKAFNQPKPVQLIEYLISILPGNRDSIVLDAFAGSGTTAHAVINLNAADSGNRRFILIESQPYAETIAAERVRRVAPDCPFSFYEIGKPLFIDEHINPAVELRQIHEYVYFSETRQPLPTVERKYLLGIHDGVSYYYLHDQPLDVDFLFSTLSDGAKERIIYAPKCLLGGKFLSKYRAEFKRIPSDILRL